MVVPVVQGWRRAPLPRFLVPLPPRRCLGCQRPGTAVSERRRVPHAPQVASSLPRYLPGVSVPALLLLACP